MKKKNPLPKSISPNLLPLCDCALENSKLLLSKLNNLLEQIGKKWRINRILKSCFFLVIQKLTTTKKKFPSVVHTLFFSKKSPFFCKMKLKPWCPEQTPPDISQFLWKKIVEQLMSCTKKIVVPIDLAKNFFCNQNRFLFLSLSFYFFPLCYFLSNHTITFSHYSIYCSVIKK